MSIKSKFEKIDLEKLKSESPQAYGILNGWAKSTKNFTDDEASEVVEPLFNKLYDKIATGKLWYVIEGNKQPKDQVAEPVTKKEEETIVKQVVKSEPKEPKVKATKTATKKTHTSNANKVKHVPTPPKLGGKSVFEVAKELREKDPTLKQRDAVRMAGKMVKDAHNKAKDEELQSLMKMIKSDPRYSVLRPDKNTSIIRDLGRPAIRTTKRVSRKGWKNQYGASDGGRTYYENRVNRMDVDKVPMYAKGGELAGVVVYDNGGESFDRYTIFTPDGSVYGMSENASGFNMYIGDSTEIEKGSHLGKKLKSVPEGIKKAVLDRMSETFAKGGNVDGKMSFTEFEETLQEYEKEGGFGKTLEKGYIMYYLPKGDPMLNTKFRHRNKRKAYQEYLEMGKYAKGGQISVYNLKKGDKVKTRDGKIETILKKSGSGSYFTEEGDYSHSPESLEFISRPSMDKFAKGGSTHGNHLPTSNVEYFRKGKIDKLMIGGKEISEDDILSGVFAKKFAKGGEVVGDYSILAYKTKDDYKNDTDERYFGMKNRSLDYVIDEFDSRVDSGLFYGYKITKGGDFANVIYQSSRDSKGGVSKRLEKTGKDYRVLGYKTKADFNDLDNEKYSGVTDRSLEYTKNLFDEKIKSGMWYGYQIFESGDMRNAIYTNTKDGEFAKGGKVYNRSWHQDHYNVNKSEKWEKQGDSRHGKTARNRKVFAKGGKVESEIANELGYDAYQVWEKLGIKSGADWHSNDELQKKMADGFESAGIDKTFESLTDSQKEVVYGELEKNNEATLINYLALRGYLGYGQRKEYENLFEEYFEGFLDPKNVESAYNFLVVNPSSTQNSVSKKGYIYVPKADITSIEYMKDGESYIAKNKDILDGAYIKLSSSSFAEGGRLPKGEVMYVPKKDIEDIIVVDSGFKANNITDELLSGIHIKASALSKQPTSQSTPSKGAKFDTTRIYKGYNGWTASTMVTDVDGKDYDIHTMKRSNGKLWSNAQQGKMERGMFSFLMYQDPNISLIETKPAKVTEKAVSEQHDKAVAKFKEMKGL